jgi:RHS repeat-associated protein
LKIQKLHDRLGSVRQVVNDQGQVRNYYTYQPFGEVFAAENTENVSNPFKFTGQWFDDEIDEYHLRARQYFPRITRFTTRDPISGKFQEPLTLHKYLYCGNDPLNLTDPAGLWYVDLNYAYSYGTGRGGMGGPLGALAGSLTVTAGLMFGTEEGATAPDLYSYFGGGLTLSARGGHTFTLTGSRDSVSPGWNLALSVI